mgnify:CR=1 FL=1
MSLVDYRHTVESLRGEVERLARRSYAKDFEIHRLQDELKKSCTLMEVRMMIVEYSLTLQHFNVTSISKALVVSMY